MEKGGGNKEFYCSQQVQLPERERRWRDEAEERLLKHWEFFSHSTWINILQLAVYKAPL